MATFSVALLIILIGVGFSASSVRADEQQNETENGENIKHLFGTDGIYENQNALAEKMAETEAKLENQIENGMLDKQNALDEKVSGIEAKLEQIENGMLDIQNLLSNKLEKEIRDNQKALSSMKNMLFHSQFPIFRWNAYDCHSPGIVINESTNAIQRNATGTEEFYVGKFVSFSFARSCRAEPIKMPSAAAGRIGIIYTEYRIVAGNGPLSIGLSTKEMPLHFWVGDGRVSYGYTSFGAIESTNSNGHEVINSDNVPSFRIGDVGGCGLNSATRQLFFTKNGQRLNITNLYVDEGTEDLYPTVTLQHHGDAVEANFGPNFEYDLSKEF
ncbi:hypothetical protein niasHT_003622 [Heterodera trifolii]|uniref:B30.2/SPRY domain-containing protein n=1 Tax=Heterodera trifolii TaxID=157864 RepID=A0ABD2MG02_9BILA